MSALLKQLLRVKLIFLFSFLLASSEAQVFEGVVLNKGNTPLRGVSVSLKRVGSPAIFSFTTSREGGGFTIERKSAESDSIEIAFSYIGFQPATLRYFGNYTDTFRISVVLDTIHQSLPPVIITPDQWKRGDTTFFKVDAFKEGEERKLIDVVEKLPGFLMFNDILYFRGKRVEKVFIDHEELFEDKVQLLLKNFPLHAIENIQMLENQGTNPRLKGLESGNRVYMNLQLKEKYVNAGLGDWEAGIDTEVRHILAGTLFSVAGKTKAGIIVNNNTIGSGVESREEYELKTSEASNSQQHVMAPQSLSTFRELENRYYIHNNKFDIRAKVNSPVSEKVKMQTEVNFLHDKQHQQSFIEETLINDSSFLDRSRVFNNQRKPSLLQLSNQITVDVDSFSEWKIKGYYLRDYTSGRSENILTVPGSTDSFASELSSKFNHLQLYATYLKRKSETVARLMELTLSNSHSRQQGITFSNAYPGIFLAPDFLTAFHQPLNHRHFQAKAGFNTFRKKGKITFRQMWGLNYEHLSKTSTPFLDSIVHVDKHPLHQLESEGDFLRLDIVGKTTGTFNIKTTPINFVADYGYTLYHRNEPLNNKSKYAPLIGLNISGKTKLMKQRDNFSVGIERKLPDFAKYTGQTWSSGMNAFTRGVAVMEPVTTIDWNYYYSPRISKKITVFLSLNGYRHSAGFAYRFLQNGLVSFIQDTIVKKPFGYYSIGLNVGNIDPFSRFSIRLSSHLSFSNGWVLIGEEVHSAGRTSFSNQLNLSKNWNKKFYLNLIGRYDIQRSHAIGDREAHQATIYSVNINPKYYLKNFRIALDAGTFSSSSFTSGKNFFYSDAEIGFSFKKLPVQFSVNLQNITNEPYLKNVNYSLYYQSTYRLPLIPRTLLLRARMEI